jgi:hypothetical protein
MALPCLAPCRRRCAPPACSCPRSRTTTCQPSTPTGTTAGSAATCGTPTPTAVLTHAFDTLGLPAILATTDDANEASLRLLTRLLTRDEARGRRLARFPDTQLPAAKPRAGGRRRLPDIQSPTPDAPPGVGGHTRADLVDHQPRPHRHHPGIDRDGLPGARPTRGRDPLARMAGHLKAAKQGPASSGRAGRRHRLHRPGRGRRQGGGRVGVAAGRQEHPTGDRAEQRHGRRQQATSVSSTDRHVSVV